MKVLPFQPADLPTILLPHVAPNMPPNHPASNGISSVTNPGPVPAAEVGPHPSHIQVAKPFLFQQQLQNHLVALGINPTREDIVRLHGVQWINEVRTALQL